MPETQSITTNNGLVEGSWNGNCFTLAATPVEKKDKSGRVTRTNTAFFLVDKTTGTVVPAPARGMSVGIADLPADIRNGWQSAEIVVGGVNVPLQRGVVQRKDRKTQRVTGTHDKVHGTTEVTVDGKPMTLKVLISQPKPDRLFFSAVLVNIAQREAKAPASASSLFGG